MFGNFIGFILFGFILISISLFFKLTVAPFHLWALDVYEGCPLFIMIFLSILPKFIFFIIIFKLYYIIFFSLTNYLTIYFLIIAGLSFIIGSIGGLYQLKIRRLLVYSMIYNNGYFLLMLANPSLFNMTALCYFLVIYILNLLGLFICIIALRSAITGKQITSIYSLTNLLRINPLIAVSFIFLLFSLSGIPPLIGFFGKFYLLYTGFNNEFLFIICLGLFTSIINTFYYIKLIKIIAFTKNNSYIFFEPISFFLGIILFFILFALIFVLIIPSIFFDSFKILLLGFL
jgi:NADH-quinone oxidoreductase subunit N